MLRYFYDTPPAIHPDTVTGFEHRSGIETAHYSRDTQFAGDDGRVRKRRAHVGDDCRGAWEDGRPADVSGNRYQDFSGL